MWNQQLDRNYLRLSGIEWILKEETIHTELNRFGTKLWMERAKDNIILSASGPKLRIQVCTSSFLEVKDKLEFKVKLLCKPSDSDIALKIKVKGQRPITSTGATVDKVAYQIASEVIRRLSADYGKSKFRSFENRQERPVTRSEDSEDLIQSNGESAPTTKKLTKPPSNLTVENLIPESEEKTKSFASPVQSVPQPETMTDLLQAAKGSVTQAAQSTKEPLQSTSTSLIPSNPSELIKSTIQAAERLDTVSQTLNEVEKSPADAGDRYARLAATSLGL